MIGTQVAAAAAVDAQLDDVADPQRPVRQRAGVDLQDAELLLRIGNRDLGAVGGEHGAGIADLPARLAVERRLVHHHRSEEHTTELQSLMRTSYAVFCLKKKKKN